MSRIKNIIAYHILTYREDAKKCTQKDSELINEAQKLHYTDWDKAATLEQEAESDYAKRILHDIRVYLYHIDEGASGLL